jgi:predicted TIM-barrel fold metal-dependent hydrolase
MELMGIDQVMIVPTLVVVNFPFMENVFAARTFARAYNNWAADYCKAAPDRLHAFALLPVHNVGFAVEELWRVAKLGFRSALIRPWDALGRYPNHPSFEPLWQAFEETGLVVGMHTFPLFRPNPDRSQASPGQLLDLIQTTTGIPTGTPAANAGSFIFEAMVWTANVLLSDFLDRHARLKMMILESNATWLPVLLEQCDRANTLYKRERRVQPQRRPSEAFRQQMYIAFESDEEWVFRLADYFENIGIWSSDAYHFDAASVWPAITSLEEHGVSQAVQAKLLGGNAARAYGIEQQLFVTTTPREIPRPAWFPSATEVQEAFRPLANAAGQQTGASLMTTADQTALPR